jgi:hypothetical protein
MKRLVDEEAATEQKDPSLSSSHENNRYLKDQGHDYLLEEEEDNEGDVTADTEIDTENIYQSDDESDALRSLPTTAPFLNTELSQDLVTEYDEENDGTGTPSLMTKVQGGSSSKMPRLYSQGTPLGSKQSHTLSRKVRSQSPHDGGIQTIKVSDDSEGLPVSRQKRVTPEKIVTQPLVPSAAIIAEQNSRVSLDLPLPPPLPQAQPRALVQSPQPIAPIEFDSDLLIERNEVSDQRERKIERETERVERCHHTCPHIVLQITLTHKIGEGFFGEVWKAKWNHTQDIAVKKMKHEATTSSDVGVLPFLHPSSPLTVSLW